MTMSSRPRLTEHGLEPVPGLPEALPPGETLLWQGAPAWGEIAQRIFLLRWVMIYFIFLAAWEILGIALQGGSFAEAIGAAATLSLVGGAAIGILVLLAKIMARGSVYTITSRRLVMRVGVALPITINIPFAVIAGAYLRQRKDGFGDIVLDLLPTQRISWIALWPHCGGWSFGRPKPMLRGVANAAEVAGILGNAVAQMAGGSVTLGKEKLDVPIATDAAAMA